MKKLLLFALIISLSASSYAQISTSRVPISETFSPNLNFKVESISYDTDLPTLKGIAKVIKNKYYDWNDTVYTFNRSFDLLSNLPFHLFISNDGKKVAYFIDRPYFDGEENKCVTIYENGKFVAGYTASEFSGCDGSSEKCDLFYNNSQTIKDSRKSNSVLTVFKDNTTEQERFLYDNYIFDKNDTIYVVDARKKVTLYNLNTNQIIKRNIPFDSIYPQIKNYRRTGGTIKTYQYPYKYVNDIENVSNNQKLSAEISKLFKLKFISQNDTTWRKYKLYNIKIRGYLNKNGTFEVEKIDVESPLEKQQILDYLKKTKFKTDFIPNEVNKIYLLRFLGGYRSFDDKIAQRETEKTKEIAKIQYQQNMTADSINHFYIPKNMEECIVQLDKALNFESKKQIIDAKDVSAFTSHMGGLGMWVRNNWGLHGGSRLITYFKNRNLGKSTYGSADEISYYIIDTYANWLKGNKNAAKDFEKKYPTVK